MSIENIEINRVYRCCDKKCEGIISVTQKCSDDFLKTCPFCHQDELVIETANMSISTVMELSVPKTFGAQSDINCKRREKELGKIKPKDPKPWFRQKDKVDFKILQNPHKYIIEGKA